MDFRPASSGSGSGASIGTATPIVDGTATAGVSTTASADDHVHPTDTSRAALASPTFSGTPSLPTGTTASTQSAGDSSTKIATTAFATTANNLKADLASPTFTGHPVGVTESALTNSTRLATTAYADSAITAARAIPLGVYSCIRPILGASTVTMSPAVVTTLLVPTFHMLEAPPSSSKYTVSQLGVRVGTGSGSTTIGVAIYSIVWTGTGTFTATLAYQLNASLSGASGSTMVYGDGTTGAPASGAGTLTLDWNANQYMIGSMASTATTLTIDGAASVSKLGSLVLTSAARSSVTDWPSTFADSGGGATAGALGATNRLNATFLVNADGKNYL